MLMVIYVKQQALPFLKSETSRPNTFSVVSQYLVFAVCQTPTRSESNPCRCLKQNNNSIAF